MMITQADLKELNVRIAAAGGKPGDVNAAIVAAIAAGVLPAEGNPFTDAILVPLRDIGKALDHVQEWSKVQQAKLKAEAKLPPGQVVVDAATGAPADGLVPLEGQDLKDMVFSQVTGQYNAELAARLGAQYSAYLSAYGPGQRWYEPAMMALATNPTIRRTYASPRSWALANGAYNALTLPEQWEGFKPTFAGGHTVELP